MGNKQQYQHVGNANPGRSGFDLSYAKLLNCDMGQLIPVMHDECVPGDVFNIKNEMVIRMQALVAPMLHEVNAYVHYFFVPYRLLWTGWETFITGGVQGDDTSVIPRWQPTTAFTAKYSLWDYFGFPVGANYATPYIYNPLDFPRGAYNLIYNEWYRDQTLQSVVSLTNQVLLFRNWEKDYFTSSLPFQQRGTAPALPISGTTQALWPPATVSNQTIMHMDPLNDAPYNADNKDLLENNTVDLSSATTFDVADLRLAFQIQKWLERNARAGVRYTEFLKAHFGVSPNDSRLDRPEYIGGTKQSIIVSEVMQTSSTDGTSPQGNLAGHGLSADGQAVGKYRVEEYGMIMGLLSIMPRTAYSQGIDRQWLRETRYDFYSPEFANLSEQGVLQAEIFSDGVLANDGSIFGYQGRYDEMRTKKDLYCADMRTTFDYWHLGRIFASAPALNSGFLVCNPSKRIFAVQTEPGWIVHFNNQLTASRPLPIMSNPGLIDH